MKVTSDPVSSGGTYEAPGVTPAAPSTQDAGSVVSPGSVDGNTSSVPADVAAARSSAHAKGHLEDAGYDWADWLNPDEQDASELDAEQTALLDAFGDIGTADVNVQKQIVMDVWEAVSPMLPETGEEVGRLAAEAAAKLGIDLDNMSIYDLIALLLVMGMEANIKNSRMLAQASSQSAQDRMMQVLAEVKSMREKIDKSITSAENSLTISLVAASAMGAMSFGGAKLQSKFEATKVKLGKVDKALDAKDQVAAKNHLGLDSKATANYELPDLQAEHAARLALNESVGTRASLLSTGAMSGQAATQAAVALQQSKDQLAITEEESDIREAQGLGQSEGDMQALESKGVDSVVSMISDLLRGANTTVSAVNELIARTVVA